MAVGIEISMLPALPGSPNNNDLLVTVQGGVTYKMTELQLISFLNTVLTITESQVTGLIADLNSKLNTSGGTMTGNLILNADPTLGLQAATKQYVDAVAIGLQIQGSCYAGTTANLTALYNNGSLGVGATLTNSGAFAVFAVDGVTPPLNSRVLIKDQTSMVENGIYTVTNQGDAISVNWILTRATDYDTPPEISPGDLVIVNNGTVNATSSWLQTDTVTTIGTDPIQFDQFTASPSSFLRVVNNLSDVANATTSWFNLQAPGYPQHAIAGATVLTSADFGKQVLCSGAAGYNVTLPAVSANKFIDFQVVTTSFAIVNLVPASGTIAGQASFMLGSGESCRLYCDGTNWFPENLYLQPVSASVYLSAPQSIANNLISKVLFDTVLYDIGGFYDSVTNHIYTPKYPGKYSISSGLGYAPSATANFAEIIYINKNGSIVKETGWSTSAVTNEYSFQVVGQLSLNGTTDFIEIDTFQMSGGPLNTDSGQALVYFDIQRISNF